jgi:GMP reductase
MKSVVSEETCEYLAKNNWFYIMHRFSINQVEFIDRMQKHGFIASISMGVNDESYVQLNAIKSAKLFPEYICVDIANCWSPKGERMIKTIKDTFPDTFLIAGNVATAEAVIEIESWGADAEKVGISNGSVCETFKATGFGRPQFSTDLDCCSVAKKPIISDGAVMSIGDISKSLVAGATLKMCGNLFAGYSESAGSIIETEGGHLKKEYFGSASADNKGEHKNVEGKRILVDYKGNMSRLLYDIKAGVSSAVSYAGGKDLSALRNVKYTYATPRHW